MKNKTKSMLCRVGSGVIGAGLPIAVLCTQFDFFVQRSETTVSAIGIIAVIIGAVSFKDALIKFFKTPTALKLWLVVFVFAVLIEPIIYQFKIVALFGLAGQGISIPLDLLSKKFDPPKTNLEDLAGQVAEAMKNEKS